MSSGLLSYQLFKADSESGNTKPPLLFLHGMLGERQNWNSQAKLFANKYQVISVDLRNHGDSFHEKGMSYQQMSEDVLLLLKHLGISRINLCGHSMGGKVAMYLALHHAEVINKLIVVDIAPVNYPLWHQEILKALLALPVSEMSSRRQADELLAKDIDDPFERAFLLKNLLRADVGFQWKCNLQEVALNYLKIAAFPDEKGTYVDPVLFIKGEDSGYISEEYKPLISGFFPNAVIKTIEGAGHLPHVQQPALFFDQLSSFLEA